MKIVTLLWLACLLLPSLAPAADWQEILTDQQINVFSRPQSNSEFAEFKAVMVVPSTLQQAIALITDTKAASRWLDHCAGTTLLTQPVSNQALVYTIIQTPWPLHDRDTVIQFTFEPTADSQGMHIAMQGKPDYLPAQKNKVRIPELTGSWLIEAISAQQTRITYELSLNPGGHSPAWVVDAFSRQGIYKTLANLHRMLSEQQHDNLAMHSIR